MGRVGLFLAHPRDSTRTTLPLESDDEYTCLPNLIPRHFDHHQLLLSLTFLHPELLHSDPLFRLPELVSHLALLTSHFSHGAPSSALKCSAAKPSDAALHTVLSSPSQELSGSATMWHDVGLGLCLWCRFNFGDIRLGCLWYVDKMGFGMMSVQQLSWSSFLPPAFWPEWAHRVGLKGMACHVREALPFMCGCCRVIAEASRVRLHFTTSRTLKNNSIQSHVRRATHRSCLAPQMSKSISNI